MLNFLLHIVQNVTTRVAAILFMATILVGHAYGQDHTVVAGSSYNYTTSQNAPTGTSTFNWTVTGGVNGTNFSYSTADQDNSIAVSWLQSGIYTVSVQEVSGSCASGNTTSNVVTVVPNDVSVGFLNASSSDCPGGAGNITLDLSIGGTSVAYAYPIVITYTVTEGAVTSAPRTRTITSPDTQVSLGSEDNIMINTGNTAIARTITITGVIGHGATLSIGTNSTYIYTVNPRPILSPIITN